MTTLVSEPENLKLIGAFRIGASVEPPGRRNP